jgi:hypothetical protein
MSLENELKSKKYLPQARGVRKYSVEDPGSSSILARQSYLSLKYVVMISRTDKEIDLITKFNLPKVLFKIRT